MTDGFVEYSDGIGAIVANLQTLELCLRVYLYNNEDPASVKFEKAWGHLAVGDLVLENSLTDWSSLAVLIDRYNLSVSRAQPTLAVDKGVVEIRDSLAHGRLWQRPGEATPTLVKFAKPSSGRTTATFVQVSSSQWLRDASRRVYSELEKVQSALEVEGRGRPTKS